ncbi:MAG: Fe-S cluster assembly scaffold IscU [Legionellales bacterium]|nr:Fe-S cluster assembly scaffold IscU [Legionellales bacterium]|tara:strand:- start:17858 stop:18238 length:381 start_codon:yes stop_codon:yes gene_type:complete
MHVSELVKQHFATPQNIGTLEIDDNVGSARVGSTARGTVLHLQIHLSGQTLIDKVRLKVHGCGYTIACASYVSEWLEGKSLDDAKQLSSHDIARTLELPEVKRHCALLAEDAVKAAIIDYEEKHHD